MKRLIFLFLLFFFFIQDCNLIYSFEDNNSYSLSPASNFTAKKKFSLKTFFSSIPSNLSRLLGIKKKEKIIIQDSNEFGEEFLTILNSLPDESKQNTFERVRSLANIISNERNIPIFD